MLGFGDQGRVTYSELAACRCGQALAGAPGSSVVLGAFSSVRDVQTARDPQLFPAVASPCPFSLPIPSPRFPHPEKQWSGFAGHGVATFHLEGAGPLWRVTGAQSFLPHVAGIM